MARRSKVKSSPSGSKAKSKAKARKPARVASVARKASAKRAGAVKRAKPALKPIDLYFWPTANGKKVTIMLEECHYPYVIHPIDIAKGDQFAPEFLAISPNNRMPAIVDPDGPGGKPISIFESGAILQYLGRKTGKFYPADERGRAEVDQWVFWQVGGLGPMGGQANHFRNYAPEQIAYAVNRYTDEVNRLFGVMDRRLAGRPFLAGKYSIADMISYSWVKAYKRFGQDMDDFPNLKRWVETLDARPGVQRGQNPDVTNYAPHDMHDPKVRAVLFNQRAR
jgi:GST-like protein